MFLAAFEVSAGVGFRVAAARDGPDAQSHQGRSQEKIKRQEETSYN
jgi:hypothetical protein